MAEDAEKNTSITLKASVDINRRIETLTLLFNKAEAKVNHADMYRQRNMNYCLVIFAGLIALGVNLNEYIAQVIISSTLLVFMLIFCIWDRRWHKVKHGWQGTAVTAYRNICNLTNNNDVEISFYLYEVDYEAKAEFDSWQPIVYYTLLASSLLSFLLFYLISKS